MGKWEYRALVRLAIPTRGDWLAYKWQHDEKDARSSEELLNALGSEGWELVTATCVPSGNGPGGHLHYLLKRPKS